MLAMTMFVGKPHFWTLVLAPSCALWLWRWVALETCVLDFASRASHLVEFQAPLAVARIIHAAVFVTWSGFEIDMHISGMPPPGQLTPSLVLSNAAINSQAFD